MPAPCRQEVEGSSQIPESKSRPRAPVKRISELAGDEIADAELVQRMGADDDWAKEMFYRRHVEQVHRLARRLVIHPQDAEDVVQEAFSQAFRDLHALQKPEAVRGWLMRIVVHRAHRKFRTRRFRRALGLDRSEPEQVELVPSRRADPEMRAELEMVARVLSDLPLRERTAWVLRHVEGYSLLEAAEASGCSLATVKRRIARVDERLRSHARGRSE